MTNRKRSKKLYIIWIMFSIISIPEYCIAESSRDILTEAYDAYISENYREIKNIINDLFIYSKPTSKQKAEGWWFLALSYYQMNDKKNALYAYNEACKNQPSFNLLDDKYQKNIMQFFYQIKIWA